MTGLTLSATKRALLSRLLQQQGLAPGMLSTVTRSQRGQPAPLSFGQQRLWFLQQLDPGSHLYNIPIAIRFQGDLDVASIGQSLNNAIRRHESLRTVFLIEHGHPVQVVNPSFCVDLSAVPLQSATTGAIEKEISRHAAAEASHVFDLVTGPLLRAKLLRINDSEHILLVCLHHIICDGWSVGIFLRDLAAFYNAHREGRSAAQLPELPMQYQDFARWQQQQERQDELALQLLYWKDQLKEVPPMLELPTDHPRSRRRAFGGSAIELSIAKDLRAALSSIARAEDATLFMALVTAFSILLFRYSGQEDIPIGTPIAGRNQPELEDLIGFFVNTLVLRTRVSADVTFRELLRSIKETCLGAYAHQDVPFEKLVGELHPQRDLGHSPLFQVMIDLQNAPGEPARFDGLSTALLPVPTESAKFDLTLTLYETDEGLDATLEYSTELFEHATASRIAENFRTLIAGIATHPDLKVCLLPVLSEAERTALLAQWNHTWVDVDNSLPVHRSFEQQVARGPNRSAVVCDGQSLSYRELNRRANRLAHYLRACGAGPEVLVGICLERSIEFVIAALAALKAGSGYVPLDPAYPYERLTSVIQDSRLRLLLTEDRFLRSLPLFIVRSICLDLERPTIALHRDDNLPLETFGESTAYVIYTSGSTGRPKGVVVSHSNLAHSTCSRLLYYNEQVAAFLLLSPCSFDSSAAGLFWTLCYGGTLVIPREGAHYDTAYLAALIEEHSISHLLCLPALYDLLLQHESKKLASLRTAIVAGEVCPVALVLCHRDRLPDARLFNEYGPTEGTVWSSVFDCTAAMPANCVPIGRPISNTRIYLLDDNFEPVPAGAVGEAYISGAGVARGYLHCPELTADRFIPDPLSGAPGGRFYRTGDLARHGSSGNIEFLGRNDFQVKIRGYRIEPDEIETCVLEHPAVHQAAVVSRAGALICCVVLKERRGATTKELRNHLAGRLPPYMVPSELIFMDSLPTTPSGKINRRALALSTPQNLEPACDYMPPGTALEQVLAQIFASVLGRERLGVHDNFFEAGGHSLLATQAVSRIREALQVDLPLRKVFEEPTIAGLAAAILSNSTEGKRVMRTAELLLTLPDVTEEQPSGPVAAQGLRERVS